jgi:hypothetical protein
MRQRNDEPTSPPTSFNEVLEEVEDTDIEEDALKEEEAKANLETQIQQVDIVNNTAKSYRETGASKPSSVTQ